MTKSKSKSKKHLLQKSRKNTLNKTKKNKNPLMELYVKKWIKIDGKIVKKFKMHQFRDNNKVIIKAQDGKTPINIRRTYKIVKKINVT